MSPLSPSGSEARPPRAAAGAGHQAQKSATTRARLIDATIRCLVRDGYAKLTTLQVATEAGLSRGAMLHHFENGATLIRATIDELHERRLRAFRRAAAADDRHSMTMIDAYWRQVQKPAFIAFSELELAARTDAALAEILRPLQREFQERFAALATELYPEWAGSPDRLALALGLSQVMIEGMALGLMLGTLREDQVDGLLGQLHDQVVTLRPLADQVR